MNIILSILFLIYLFNHNQPKPEIINCKISEATDENRSVTCVLKKENTKAIAKFTVWEWPQEWSNTVEVGDIVKIKINNNIWEPIPSCAARIETANKNAIKNKVREGSIPTNSYIPKDCQ